MINNRYHIIEKLGEGGMGAVMRVHDYLSDSEVALKRLHVQPNELIFNSRTDDTNLSLAQEFRILASLRHPHIVDVLDYGFDEAQHPYFTMSLLYHPQTIREAAETLDLDGKIDLMIQLLQALAYLHRRGIIHRDLKPANILVEGDEVVRVVDFGLAVESGPQSIVAGTMMYMAPECLVGQDVTRQSDLYAVGVLLYEILKGEHPFKMVSPNQLILDIIEKIPDTAYLPLADVIDRLLLKTPQDRFPTAEAVIEALCAELNRPVPQESQAIRESFIQAAQFIGRTTEINRLMTGLDQITAETPQGGLWLIGGESGVGKSRLLEELRIRALIRRTLVLRGQASEGDNIPFHLWRNVIRQLVLSTTISDLEAGILKPIVPDIAGLLGRPVADVPDLGGDAQFQRLATTVVALFQRQTQPVVLLLEDLQWTRVNLVRALARVAGGLRLMIVGTYRNDERPDLPDELPPSEHITLTRLNENDIAALSTSMLGQAGERQEVVQLLHRETEGNVFFLVEVVRALAEEAGGLDRIGFATLPDVVFAGGMRRLVERRLMRVPTWGQDLLKVAAVHGRQIDLKLLEAIPAPASGPINLNLWLDACANAAVLDMQDGYWRFTHDKLREAVLENLTADEKPELHRQVAQAIEQQYSDHLDTYASILAHHWQIAGDTDKEIHYTLQAADQTSERGYNREAIAMWERVLHLTGNPDATLYHQIGHALMRLGNYPEAERWQQQALTMYQEQGDEAGIARSTGELGDINLRLGKLALAREQFETSLAINRRLGLRKQIAFGLMNLGNLAQVENDTETSLEYRKQCYELMRDVDDLPALTKALNNLAISYDMAGDLDHALEIHNEALEIRRRIDDRQGIVSSLVNMGFIYHVRGQYDEAQRLGEESLQIAQEIDFKMVLGHIWALLGDIARDDNRLTEAEYNYRQSAEIRLQLGEKRTAVMSFNQLAQALQQQGRFDDALQQYRQTLTLAQEVEIPASLHHVLRGIAELFIAQGDLLRAAPIVAFLKQHAPDMTLEHAADIPQAEVMTLPDLLAFLGA